MRRRDKAFLGFSLSALAGTTVVVAVAAWFLWKESTEAEEKAVEALAATLGQRTERIIVDARALLDRLNELTLAPCSDAHLRAMDEAAFSQPHILAIGYWQAAERLCGAGFTQAIQLKPPKADRIYESGVIAWWPGPQTEVDGVEIFLMRFGQYDVALDPRMLLQATPTRGRQVGLWVEGLRMASVPIDAGLPDPDTLSTGLTVDQGAGRMVSRVTLDTVFPIDVVVVEPIGQFWNRYWPAVALTGAIVLILTALWLYSVSSYTRRRLSLSTELREALAQDRIDARYQPIIDLATGHCVGAEVLARWTREGGESVEADTLISVAEHAGLVPRITLAMLDATLRDLGRTLRAEPHLRINLNLAPEDLESTDFSEALAARVERAGVTARNMKLEITERALINSEDTRRFINHLRGQGHEIAIDDFGTGYSSLSYLESFELDTLKIDKSFVDAIGTGSVTSNVIYHVIEMAKGLQLDIVAEGVETREQAQWLRSQGVAYAQGFLYSRPLSARGFQHYLRTHKGSNVYSLRGLRRAGSRKTMRGHSGE